MKIRLSAAVCAAALLMSGGLVVDAVHSPVLAQISVSFNYMHDQLAPYGDWVYSDRWGEVWIPEDVPDDFRPYDTDGHWVYTDDYGWYWVSDYDWGDLAFHYGRWVNDPDDGWLWIPGYVWGPGWVVWRHNGEYTGWMPMPPDDSFLGYGPQSSIGILIGGLSISFNSGDYYGYRRWYGSDYDEDRFASNWIFIGTGHMGDRDYRRYEAPRQDYVSIIHNTTNITNYTVVNNYVVNRSVDPNAVRMAGGHVQVARIADVVKRPQLVTTVNAGREMQMRAREMRPHGNGMADSAPKPTPQQIQTLSTRTPSLHGGNPPAHLFTRETIGKAQLPPRPEPGKPMRGPGPMTMPPASGPATQPGVSGSENPAAPPPEERRGKHRGPMNGPNGPGMNGPAMNGPAATQPGVPGSENPAALPPEETRGKHRGPMNGPNGPAMNGPAMNGPLMEPGAQEEKPKRGRKPEAIGPSGPPPSGPTEPPERPRNFERAMPPSQGPGTEEGPRGMENPAGPPPRGMEVNPPGGGRPPAKEEKPKKKPEQPGDGGG